LILSYFFKNGFLVIFSRKARFSVLKGVCIFSEYISIYEGVYANILTLDAFNQIKKLICNFNCLIKLNYTFFQNMTIYIEYF